MLQSKQQVLANPQCANEELTKTKVIAMSARWLRKLALPTLLLPSCSTLVALIRTASIAMTLMTLPTPARRNCY